MGDLAVTYVTALISRVDSAINYFKVSYIGHPQKFVLLVKVINHTTHSPTAYRYKELLHVKYFKEIKRLLIL